MTHVLKPIGRLVIATALLGGCRGAAPIVPAVLPPPTLPAPSVTSQWVAMQTLVLQLVQENRPVQAESSLTQFSRENPHTPEGDRARWWRTLMRVDSRANTGDAAIAISQIDSLLTDSVATEVRTEAVLTRRNITATLAK